MMIDIHKEKRQRRRVRVKNVDGKDRLSDLPDSILIHILSLLDNCKTAVQSSVLSKRWKNLWIYLPNLYFTNLTMGQKSYKLENFVDMVLTRRDPNVKLHSFSLRWVLRSTIPQTLLDRIHQYAQSHHVQHFNLCIRSLADNAWTYPSHNFNPTSLTTLWLNLSSWCGGLRDRSDDNCMLHQRYLAGLTALETLCLEDFDIVNYNHPLDLFSSLQNLKELILVGCWIYGKDDYFNISAPGLERLTILDKVNSTIRRFVKLRISSPTLKYLRLDLWAGDFSVCNQPFLEELEINVHPYKASDEIFFNESFVKNLIKALGSLSHAKSATISQSTLQVNVDEDLIFTNIFSFPKCLQLYFYLYDQPSLLC